MKGPALIDVDRAQVLTAPDGTVTVDDPDSPLLLSVRVVIERGRPQVVHVALNARHPDARISTAALGRLPLTQVVYLAAQRLQPGGHPNEAHYRALARPKPRGQRGWDDGHWERVLAVYRWARDTRRPGGGVQAVADLWGVSASPTAVRWLREARRRAAAGVAPLVANG